MLDDINLKIRSGMTVGIVGGTGSAKSSPGAARAATVRRDRRFAEGRRRRRARLRPGGPARPGGHGVAEERAVLRHYRREPALGQPERHRRGDRHAAQLAQADGFIQEFPEKYDTYIEQGGTNVSGGQRQRLCIARALLKKPKILILDDSTSAVDTKTDKLIRTAFHDEIPDTTKIIIAQRIASVQESDMILVMEEGRITASGTHEELLKTCDEYRSIYESQTKNQAQPEELQ